MPPAKPCPSPSRCRDTFDSVARTHLASALKSGWSTCAVERCLEKAASAALQGKWDNMSRRRMTALLPEEQPTSAPPPLCMNQGSQLVASPTECREPHWPTPDSGVERQYHHAATHRASSLSCASATASVSSSTARVCDGRGTDVVESPFDPPEDRSSSGTGANLCSGAASVPGCWASCASRCADVRNPV